ncbi:MAG: DUF1800 domain-containing protein [Acidobacteriia bacterium]|nr:DUF1800 domain-containing protein [Terriglobia bacterium]
MSSAPVSNQIGFLSQVQGRTNTGLELYQGPWNTRTAAHLLCRAALGPTQSEIALAASASLDQIIATLLLDQAPPSPPIDPTTGQTWIGRVYDSASDSRYQGYLKAWWMGLMATQGISLQEQMVLFWHNHFVSEYATVLDSRYMYQQNTLLRQYALGNIKELVKAVSIDPAMLIYLNGYHNRGDGNNIPDENYARELQELFTIGKGPEVGPGDYTNYTEQDVKAAAHLLTGWSVNGYRSTQNPDISSYFDAARHDTKDKLFSAAYQNTRITGGTDGRAELDALVEMIFRQPETARFLCRKLYRWFVYYDIDAAAESNVITPLATIMFSNNYEVKPVLAALLHSAHFFDENNIGSLIKNPIDLLPGAMSTLDIAVPSAKTQTSSYYTLMASLCNTASNLQMNLMDPPNVAGWPAYYQTPEYHRLWINTITLPARWAYTDSLVNGIRVGSVTIAVDPLALATQVSNPADPNVLVSEIAGIVFPIQLTANQISYLVSNVLIPGLPDYEWTAYWNTYIADPNNTQKRDPVVTRIKALLKFMMRMAEFELS